MEKRAIVTGAGGMIGQALTAELLEHGYEVLGILREDSPKEGQMLEQFRGYGDRLKLTCCDLKQLSTLELPKAEVCFHLAWAGTTGASRDDMYLQNENIRGVLDAVALAARCGCSCFVGAGSQAEYGKTEGALTAETPAFPLTGYGMAKLCAGQMSRKYCAELGLRHVWARILSVYGPGNVEGSMVMSAIRGFQSGEPVKFTKGEQQWDYLYSTDAARALRLMGESGKDGAVYPLGSGQVRPLAEYIQTIRTCVAPEAELRLGAIPYAPGQVMYLKADITQLTADTGFEPEISFEEGIQRLWKQIQKK